MRILILVPRQDRISGNWVSAERFRQGLENLGHRVALHDTPLQPQGELRQQLQEFRPDVALLLHAYRSGKPWLDEAAGLGIPCCVLLTGTDVNQGLAEAGQREVIRTIMQQAASVLVHNPLIAAELTASHPELAGNLAVLTPGISPGLAPYDLRRRHRLAAGKTLFLCPAGLRPVKGLRELLEMSAAVAATDDEFMLALCGPPLDAEYSRQLLTALETRPWARYLGAIPTRAMASAMRGADVIVNNSHAEGLANALLEAATLGIPILARRIPGNAAVVEHGRNGLLYEDAGQFADYARQLIDPEKRRQLSCPDPERYHPKQEAAELAAILEGAAGGGR